MKKIMLLVFISIISFYNLNAQVLDKNELIGKWKTKSVRVKSEIKFNENELQKFEELKKLLRNAVFTFDKNYNFSFISMLEDLNIEKSKWKINNKTQLIEINSLNGKDRLMDLILKKDNNKINLIQVDEDVSLVFEVEKEN